MRREELLQLLERVARQQMAPEDAARRFEMLPYEDLDFARIDHHRSLRTGAPEVVYGPGKTAAQIAQIVDAFVRADQTALVTRLDESKARATLAALREGRAIARYEPVPRLLVAGPPIEVSGALPVAVVAAGTSDLPVAEEAARTAEILGFPVVRFTDVGVAGLHRLIGVRDELEDARVVIVVAGMEGALPSVVKGLVSRPVIAVPTSVGFGANFGGVSALLGMLTSCAPGVLVVNIDNGFGAGYAASLIARAEPGRG